VVVLERIIVTLEYHHLFPLAVPSLLVLTHIQPVYAQSITPAADGTGTIVRQQGDRYLITGGRLSRDQTNLFQSFERLGLNANEIATFLSRPGIQNILGRVTGGSPSIINGLLQVTGGPANLYLINPAGLVFGPNARLDVPAAFTATTATGVGFGNQWFNAIGTNDYASLVGNPTSYAFALAQPGTIWNAGNLNVLPGQGLNLLGGMVLNTGQLTAPGGQITVAAVPGESLVRVSQPGMVLSLEVQPLSPVESDRPTPWVSTPATLPQLLTGGQVAPATNVTVDNDGSVHLTNAGTVIPTTPGTAIATGTLDTSATLPNQSGGTVRLLGNQVGLIEANVNAVGTSDGGTILIGGDYRGQGTLPTASVTYVDPTSRLNADAQGTGNGGRVIIWSDETSRVYGSIQARGGATGGNGGFVETSSGGFLDATTAPDVAAPAGQAGTWLLDPHNITIGGGTSTIAGPPFTAIADDSLLSVAALRTALIGGATVIVATGTTGTQAGDITLANDFNFDGIGSGTLRLEAANNINVNREIFDNNPTTPDTLNLFLLADSDNNGEGQLNISPLGRLNTGGGDIVGVGRSTTGTFGIQLFGPITSDARTITLTGTGATQGISIDRSTLTLTGGGSLNLTGTGGTAGIDLNQSTLNLGTSTATLTANQFNLNQANLQGSGQIVLQPTTSDLSLSNTLGSGGQVTFNTPLLLRSPNGSITTTSLSLVGQGNASISLEANQNITTGAIATAGQPITLTSTNGNIDTTGGLLSTQTTGTAGAIALTAPNGTIRTQSLNTSSSTGDGGAITLNARRIDTRAGRLDSSASQGRGGAIALTAPETITTGDLVFGSSTPGLNSGSPSGSLSFNTSGAIDLSNATITSNGTQINVSDTSSPDTILLPAAGLNTNGGNFSIVRTGDLTLNGSVNTAGGAFNVRSSGALALTGSVTTGRGNAELTATNGNLTLNGSLNTGGGLLTLNSGDTLSLTGTVTTTGGNVNATSGGPLNLASTVDTGGGTLTLGGNAVSLTGAIATAGGGVNVTSNGPLTINGPTTTGGGAFNLVSGGDFSLTNSANTGGGAFSLRSAGASTLLAPVITGGGGLVLTGTALQTNNLDTSAPGNAGRVTLTASQGNIQTGNLNASSTTGVGGEVTLTSGQGQISTGDITSSGRSGGAIGLTAAATVQTGAIAANGTDGGSVALTAGTTIRTGSIEATGDRNGGRVILDPTGNVTVQSINAQGGTTGQGGTIDVTTGRFFQATGGFSDRNNRFTSLSTSGGQDGSILIRHGGNGNPPFVVGNASVNGTAGALSGGSTGSTISPLRSFRGNFTQGTVRIRTNAPPPPPTPTPTPTPTPAPTVLTPELLCPPACPRADIPDPPSLPGPLTLEEAQQILRRIQRETGVKPALLYVNFVPVQLPVAADFLRREGNAMQQFSNYLGNAISAANLRLAIPPQPTDELEILLVLPDQTPVRHRLAGVTRSQVMPVVAHLIQEVTDRTKVRTTSYQAPAQQLYQWMIAPVAADLEARNIQNIGFVMDAGLRSLPVAALYDGQHFLVERYSVGLMPGLSLIDTRYTDIRKRPVLAMGASTFHSLPTLPAVPTELNVITQELGGGKQFLNETFTVQNLLTQRQKTPFSIIHLATHGQFSDRDNSYIQFWDQRLKLDQLRNLGLNTPPVELLVLSACRTAFGDDQAELGFAGFALQAGVKSALASLWYVSDDGTLGLMAEFYQRLRLDPIKSEALRQAQMAMLHGDVRIDNGQLRLSSGVLPLPSALTNIRNTSLSHPYYWASFVLVGSPW
jgi:filamentous hemagglutinin family protein